MLKRGGSNQLRSAKSAWSSKIDNQTLRELKSMGGQLPRHYGLAKVPKKNIPLRPLLSMPGSPYHKIAQKVTEWLSVVSESKNK